MNKFKDFPEVFCVSLESCSDRRVRMANQCKMLGIKELCFVDALDGREIDFKNHSNIIAWFLDDLDSAGIATCLSHLEAIRHWVEHYDSPYAFFCEDDMDFFISYYWNFEWPQIFEMFPEDWDSMQLSLIRENLFYDDSLFRIQIRYYDDWSAGTYMLTRDYAKKLLNNYYIGDGKIELCIRDDIEVYPVIENVLFNPGWFTQTSYMLPMFVESKRFNSTFYPKFINKKTKGVQLEWVDIVTDWWEKNGPTLNLDKLKYVETKQTRDHKSGLVHV